LAERLARAAENPSPNGDGGAEPPPWDEERDGAIPAFFKLSPEEQDARVEAALKGAVETAKQMRHGRARAAAEGEEDGETVPVLQRLFADDGDRPCFPLHVFPGFVARYVRACARSIYCSADLLAIAVLPVAGAATGRSGRRLKVKDGWEVSSCLWAAALSVSGGGKSPALNAVAGFYDDRQEALDVAYSAALRAHKKDPDNHPHPGPYPALKLTDSTLESLRGDLRGGPVLFARDELGAWCHQMGQYKHSNADRFDWCSLWSHAAISIGRKGGDRVYVREPFVAVTGMLVPASARELNYRGQADDGFVHRILLAYPEELPPVATGAGVPDELTADYKCRMNRLFDGPGEEGKVLSFDPQALRDVLGWANGRLFGSLPADAPGWLVSKYRKLFENCLRLCLVLHELWRVAGADPAADPFAPDPRDYAGPDYVPLEPGVVDRVTVARAINTVEYFRAHIDDVQSLLGEDVDDVDRLHSRLSRLGTVTVRQVMHKTVYKRTDEVLALFTEWKRRGYGVIRHPRTNQTVFEFGGEEPAG
jgi:hypothetical protein